MKPATLGAALGLGLLAVGPAALAQAYTITDLGAFTSTSQANGLNATGEVVGLSAKGGTDAAGNAANAGFTYTGSGPLQQLTTLGGTSSVATGVNAGGQVVGYSQLATDAATRAFQSSGTGPLTNLGTIAGGAGDTNPAFNSQANAINASAEVVGFSSAGSAGSTVSHAFLYTGGSMRDIGTLPGGSTSTGNGIDTLGRVVGSSTTTGGATHAYVWVPTTTNGATGTMTDLGASGGAFSNAFAINVVGQIAGLFTTSSGNIHAFRTTTPLSPINPATDDLGTLGGAFSQATALNATGTTVGFSSTASGSFDAFIFGTGVTGLTDLNTLISPTSGWTLSDATGINDRGQVVGYGTHNGVTRAFLLTPTPEPSSLIALAVAAAGTVGLMARKRRQRLA